MFKGYRTYLVAIGFTVYAAFGWWMGQIDADTAIQIVNLNGLGVFLRASVAKAPAS
jgi:hypothetical protein